MAKRRNEWAENSRAKELFREEFKERQEEDYLNRLRNKKRIELFQLQAKLEKRKFELHKESSRKEFYDSRVSLNQSVVAEKTNRILS